MTKDLTKLEQMLRDRRPPGAIVRGNGHRHPTECLTPVVRGARRGNINAAEVERRQEAVFAEKRRRAMREKDASRSARKPDGAMRHIGYVPMEQYKALQNELGRDFMKNGGGMEAFKRAGRIWDDS